MGFGAIALAMPRLSLLILLTLASMQDAILLYRRRAPGEIVQFREAPELGIEEAAEGWSPAERPQQCEPVLPFASFELQVLHLPERSHAVTLPSALSVATGCWAV